MIPCPLPLRRFARMLQFQTVSSPDVALHVLLPEEFKKLDAHLRASFPLVWEKLIVEKVGRIWGKRGCMPSAHKSGRKRGHHCRGYLRGYRHGAIPFAPDDPY